MPHEELYLDHAATSFPKAPGVVEAVELWYREQGVSAQRGDGRSREAVATSVQDTRCRVGRMCGVDPDHVVFTSGATESLNLFLHGFLRPGDRVLTTALEHSSVARPLTWLQQNRDIGLTVLAPDSGGYVTAAQVDAALQQEPHRLLVFTHASNVLGSVVEAAAICRTARTQGATTLLDASQTAGMWPIDVGADAVAASAHKSLLGPPGLGFLCVRPEVATELSIIKQGGTGSSRALAEQPTTWPEAMESGTPNTPAILGLGAALAWLRDQDQSRLRQHGIDVVDAIRRALGDRAHCYGPGTDETQRIGVLSFSVFGLEPFEAGALLAEAHITARNGFHCAPWIHPRLGTGEAGTIRVSAGPFTSEDDVLRVPRALGFE